jgi:itaconate CoA-transferase
MRGAQLSKNGKSILAAYSTANKGQVSRIVPMLAGPITDPRTETQYVVTEWGTANLRGKSVKERALALIEIGHPNFQAKLYQEAKKMGHI